MTEPSICIDHKCLCNEICSISSNCVLEHESLKPYSKSVSLQVMMVPAKKRSKKIIEILQAFHPPKVNGRQITRYYGLIKHGIDLDVKDVPKEQKIYHVKLGRKDASKKRNKILHILKSNESREKKAALKKSKRVVAEYLKANGIYAKLLPGEDKKIVYTIAAQKTGVYIPGRIQTATEFLALKEFRLDVENTPEPNFHEPE